MFTVVTSTIVTLFFLDVDSVANARGLSVAGLLLLILNMAFVLLIAVMVLLAAKGNIQKYSRWAFARAKSTAKVPQRMVVKLTSIKSGSNSYRRSIDLAQAASTSSDTALFQSAPSH